MQKVIEPGQRASQLTAGQKGWFGVRAAFSPYNILIWPAAAGYGQLLNGSPNFGTDRGAFGQRLGAAAIRDSTENIFSDSIMAPIFREDPRYYRLGSEHRMAVRALYAITRPLITRSDEGGATPNFALLSGTLAGASLTNAYYPQINRGAKQTFETFGGSIGGEAFSDFIREFFADLTHKNRPGR
jgi:hypothetical protein